MIFLTVVCIHRDPFTLPVVVSPTTHLLHHHCSNRIMKEPHIRPSDMALCEVYFWTSTIVGWKHLLKKDAYKEILLESLKYLVGKRLISVYAFVIMPNHVHFIWEMLAMNGKEMPDSSFSKFTAHEFRKDLLANHPRVLDLFLSEKNDRDLQFWQRDALAVRILGREMLLQKLNYLHMNPLNEKWNLADMPEHYKWSSAKFYETGVDDFGFLTHFMERI